MTSDLQEPPPKGEMWSDQNEDPSWPAMHIVDLTPSQFHDVVGIVGLLSFLVTLICMGAAYGW